MRFISHPAPAVVAFFLWSLAAGPASAAQEGSAITGPQGAAAAAGGYHALVIGNNAYASLPKLKTAEADARQVAALLREFYGFETTLLLNATRAQIVSALAGYRRRLGPEARLLVYYAGHGYNDREQDKAYWLPVDATRDDPANWIIADEITSAIRVIPARHVLVVSDSCYSGTLTRGLGESLPPANERERFIERMAAVRSRMLMASGGNEPVADGGGGAHSVFAGALLRGLREMGRERFTAAELFRNYVVEPVAGRAEQTPEYNPIRNSGHEGGDFVFVRVKAGGRNARTADRAPAGAPATNPAAVELSFWDSIKSSTDPEDFREYLMKYPAGQFAGLARRRAAALTAKASASPANPYPDTEDGARALLAEFVKPGADHAKLSRMLRPAKADYDAVFVPEFAAKADAAYGPAWDGGQVVVAPKAGQTQVLIFSATSEELKGWTGGAAHFPGGWKDMASQLKPGLKVYRFKFVEPGEDLGMAYDGLVNVNGHWRIFPKPWRITR